MLSSTKSWLRYLSHTKCLVAPSHPHNRRGTPRGLIPFSRERTLPWDLGLPAPSLEGQPVQGKHSFNKQQRHVLTVEKEPSPRIFPNLKSSGRFFRGCGGGCAACCSELALGRDSAAVLSMVVGPCLLPPLGTTGAVPDSVWVLTIDGDGQEHNTTLD